MKRLSSILCLATATVFMATIVSCQKEQPTAVKEETEQDGKLSVSLLGIAGEYEQNDGAKAELVANVRVKWAENDKVYVFDGVKCLGNLYVESIDANGVTAKLKGTVDTPTAGKTKVTLVHTNALTGAPTIESGNVKIDLSNQANAGSSPDNVPFVAYSTINADQLGKSLSVSFKLASSVMRLNCSNLDASANINKAKLTGMGNKVVLAITGTSDASVDGEAGDIALTFNDFKAGSKGTKTIYAAVATTTADANQVLTIATTSKETHECGLGKASINAGLSVNAICIMKKLLPFTVGMNEDGTRRTVRFAPGNLYCARVGSEGNWTYTFAFEANQWDYRGFNGYDNDKAVFNGVETTTPANTSGLFQWVSGSCTGEGAGEARRSFGAFSELSLAQISKGATESDVVDFGKVFGDDSPWRTLTQNEWFNLLLVYSDCKKAVVNGVKGFIIFPYGCEGTEDLTYIPEDCAFLPAFGLRARDEEGGKIMDKGDDYYWSCTACDEEYAYPAYFEGIDWWNPTAPIDRHNGVPVRLVSEF